MTTQHPAHTDTTRPRIYVASLSDYNAGRLHGRWIDADQCPEDIHAEITAMLSASPEPIAEEFAIHDYDGFGPLGLSEFEPVERVADIAAAIVANGPAFAAYADHVGAEYADTNGFDDAYCGEWDSFRQYAEDLPEQLGFFEGASETLIRYFDYEAFARDLLLDGHYTAPALGSGVYVFRSY